MPAGKSIKAANGKRTGSRPFVVVEHPGDGIAEVRLDRAEQRNSLSLAMIASLHAAITGVAGDDGVKAVVLSASGSVFCAGHDLKEITARRSDHDNGHAFFTEAMSSCAAMMLAIVACPKPVIAAVQGTATAAGCQLVATCDLAVAADDAQFCTPGVDIGLFCSTPMVALTRNVSAKRAMEMLLLGEKIDAARAAEWGLVNRVVAGGKVRNEAMNLARAIAAKSPLVVAVGKRTFYDQRERPLGEAYEIAARAMVENLMAPDASKGISAFLEKRAPTWKGR